MTLSEQLTLLFLLVLVQNSVSSSIVKRENNEGVKSVGFVPEKSLFGDSEEKNLEREILEEINHLNSRQQREIFENLEKQHEKFNVSNKSLVLSETDNLSPLNLAELKSIQKTIKGSNSTLPAIRNKRTLNFLLFAVARAMGFTLTPSNPDAEWIPRQQPPPAQPCSTPPPPCTPSPPSTPPPCSMPPTTPPCTGSNAMMQQATIPPNQIDANTISYPYRPARTISLFNFAPLPAGIRVPYPPLFQPPAQQRSPCTPQQPSPPPCGANPPPSQPPCGAPPSPSTPPPCRPPPPPPCGTTPAPTPPPCTTPAPPPPPCRPTQPPPPPCGTTPASRPPPCMTTPAPPPPCAPTPPPSPPPCGTPSPPPCPTPAPPPCGNPPPPAEPPKKGSIVLEYDDPVRIQIFSNEKKYLPASGNIFSGYDDDGHSENEKNRKNDEDFEEMEEEHIEEEEEDYEAPGQLKHYEEEDEASANNEEDESETSLSIVKKPVDQDIQKTHKRRLTTSKTKTSVSNGKNNNSKKNEKDSKYETSEKSQKTKTPKRKKWIRIVKKQRRKSKTDSNPKTDFQVPSTDNFPEASQISPKYFGKRQFGFDSYERDVSDFSEEPSSSEDVTKVDLKKIIVNGKELNTPEASRGYEFNFNPYALEPEDQRRKKLEKVVERYVEDYVEKQLGDELIKNTGVPKTTVFEFTPKNGPKIQTITTTVAKTSGNKPNFKPKQESHYHSPTRNTQIFKKKNYDDINRRGNPANYESFIIHT